jgi:hypothetical protein
MGSVEIGLGVFGKDFGLGFRAPRTILPSRGRELLEAGKKKCCSRKDGSETSFESK